jgi:hypothetical protein
MAIAMGGDLMSFSMDHRQHLRCSLCYIPKDEEGRLHPETIQKAKDLLDIDQNPAFTLIPSRRRKDMLDIADVVPVFYIHR